MQSRFLFYVFRFPLYACNMALEPVIGLEIHVQLTTKSKMFCSCENIFGDVPPNSAVCPICMGYPGTLPVPNKTAIEWTQKLGAALGCELARQSKFDRKHYFYPDLPKGYQISQYDQPFCKKGRLNNIGITRIHLEEDAAKNTHPAGADYTLVDFNRAGTPLVEIVTEPEFRSPAEAKTFLQDLQRIVRALKISDADMEKGQMRCDANISLRTAPPAGGGDARGGGRLNPKTEIKNLNSFRFVEKALQYEIDRQTKEHEAGRIPEHTTRGFDSERGVTFEQRTKEEAADYRYFPEPDIPPFEFSPEYLKQIEIDIPELPTTRRDRLQKQAGLSAQHAEIFANSPELSYFFEAVVSEIKQQDNEQVGVLTTEIPELVKMATNIIVRQVRSLMEKNKLKFIDLKVTPENFAEMVVLLQQGKITKDAIDPLLAEMQRTGGDPHAIIDKLGLTAVSDSGQLQTWVDQVIEGNPDVVAKIKAGKDAALQFLMGQVIAKSEGKANAKQVLELLRQRIQKSN